MVRRRMRPIRKMRISTTPPDAVVLVDGTVYGSTPITMEKPPSDAAILSGRYVVQVYLEGHKHATLYVDANLRKDSVNHEIRLSPSKTPDHIADRNVQGYRTHLPDRSMDIGRYGIEREVEGTDCALALGRDELLVMSLDRKKCLLSIPYGALNEARLEKRFMRGIGGIAIIYNEADFSGLVVDFVIDRSKYRGTDKEMKHRYEWLAETLTRKKREAHTQPAPVRLRPPEYYEVDKSDIANGYIRFDPYDFERLIARLFERKGYRAQVTQKSGDYGADVIASTGKETIAIQVKKWQANVGGPDVQKTVGSMLMHRATRAMVITTADFTNQAYEIQRMGSPVELWNGARLADEFRMHMMRQG